MNKLTHIEDLLEHIRDNADLDQQQRDAKYDVVDQCITAYVKYHNEAVDQGRQITMQRFHLNEDAFVEFIEKLHERRKELHKKMIDHTVLLNKLCSEQGVAPIYDGPLDEAKGRSDDDTRFGVAAFGEELCRDMFRTTHELGVPAKAKQAYKDHASKLTTVGKNWSALQKMMEKANAQKEMDATYQKED